MSFANSPNEFKFLAPGISANTSGTKMNAFSTVDGTNGIIIPTKQFSARPYRQVPATLTYLTGTSSLVDLTVPGIHGIGSSTVTINAREKPLLIVVTSAINALSTATYYIDSMLLRSMNSNITYPLTFAAGGSYSAPRYKNSWIAYYEFPVGTVETIRAEVNIGGTGIVGKYRSDIWAIQDHTSATPYATGTRDSGLTWNPTILNSQHKSVILANAWCNGASGLPTLTGINGPIADNAESNMIWTGYLTDQGTESSINVSAVFSAGTAVNGGWAVWR